MVTRARTLGTRTQKIRRSKKTGKETITSETRSGIFRKKNQPKTNQSRARQSFVQEVSPQPNQSRISQAQLNRIQGATGDKPTSLKEDVVGALAGVALVGRLGKGAKAIKAANKALKAQRVQRIKDLSGGVLPKGRTTAERISDKIDVTGALDRTIGNVKPSKGLVSTSGAFIPGSEKGISGSIAVAKVRKAVILAEKELRKTNTIGLKAKNKPNFLKQIWAKIGGTGFDPKSGGKAGVSAYNSRNGQQLLKYFAIVSGVSLGLKVPEFVADWAFAGSWGSDDFADSYLGVNIFMNEAFEHFEDTGDDSFILEGEDMFNKILEYERIADDKVFQGYARKRGGVTARLETNQRLGAVRLEMNRSRRTQIENGETDAEKTTREGQEFEDRNTRIQEQGIVSAQIISDNIEASATRTRDLDEAADIRGGIRISKGQDRQRKLNLEASKAETKFWEDAQERNRIANAEAAAAERQFQLEYWDQILKERENLLPSQLNFGFI